MSAVNDGGPAFPVPVLADEHGNFHSTHQWGAYMEGGAGMTLRDWFAGQVVVGAVFAKIPRCYENEEPRETAKWIAGAAYELADAMLAARNKQEGSK